MRALRGQRRCVRREQGASLRGAPPCAGARPNHADVPSGILNHCTAQKDELKLRARGLLLSAVLQGWLCSRDPNKVLALPELEVSWERQVARKHRKDR